MSLLSEQPLVVGYPGSDCKLELRLSNSSEPYRHHPSDRYWKVGIALPDIDTAADQLEKRGISVSKPRQFEDIGYLCHLQDSQGFVIELLQHHFAGRINKVFGDPAVPLGGGAHIGQVTIRTHDIESEEAFYCDRLGMKKLSVQPLPRYGFTLYFYGFTEEMPPHSNLESVNNREWLWQRPYTTLEIQCMHNSNITPLSSNLNNTGYHGLILRGTNNKMQTLVDPFGGQINFN